MEDYAFLHGLLADDLSSRYDEREAHTIARYVLEDVFGIRPPQYHLLLRPGDVERYNDLTHQLVARGRPWQYVVGRADFYGYKFLVNEKVLIPRPETEELVHWLLETAPDRPLRVLDVGTGSGCIPITLRLKRPHWRVAGLDVDEGALEVARRNAYALDAHVDFFRADALDVSGYADLPQLDLLISNPPYISRSEVDRMPNHVREHEPDLALFVTDDDPLQFYRALAKLGLRCLGADGWLYVECSAFFAQEVATLFRQAGYDAVEVREDMQGKPRLVRGQRRD